ncbi:hypothetical protein G6O69_24815 [Pseudenhygromyxa sp. WMMC2535]|uniref:hypothetical protein n=1 Tax=Pseudenhygromyxa sp. WMMC2535 TaxID=2712867 RepID=UPI001555110B|nr:hypothetical protein [Pseudenhygromyxa sp. WMMC2535]NVB41085.1 hypothetical protein [Pseudenhygromyxa sp. WMMC2535]
MDADKIKLYVAPAIAVILFLAWFFVIRPKLDDGGLDEAAGQEPIKKRLPPEELPPEPTDPAQRVR